MQAGDSRISIREEHLFWLEVLEDHAYFLRDYMSPAETQWWQEADRYIAAFHQAVRQASRLPADAPASSEPMIAFARQVYPLADGYCRLEGHIQNLRLWNRVNVNLTPTYFNGTIGENREYLRQLGYWMQGAPAEPLTLTELFDLWLEDQQGHALLLLNHLDPVERRLSLEAERYAGVFGGYRMTNYAMEEFLRFTPPGFPAQRYFAGEVLKSTMAFYRFVQGIVVQYADATVLSRATLRFLEHHFPESCYFMRKLARFVPDAPSFADCPLTKPSYAAY
ncbi:DUF2935 domain-containing protein [Cohnella sp. GCM10027633]|uniref:DUF2935 domain-containing protein n=1 Tax=unclassified Cohnella TaxID=2636738 RepID=UPI003643542B